MTNTLTTTRGITYLAEIERDPRLKSPHTRRQYKAVLSKFELWRGGRTLTKTLVEEYAAHLQRGEVSPATTRQVLAVIRWWARRVIDLAYEQLPREQAEDLEQQAIRVINIEDKTIAKGTREPSGRHIEADELSKLLGACTSDPSPAGVRDAAFIAVAIPTGARNAEIRDLTIDDLKYTPEGAEVKIRHGKGDKARTVYLFETSVKAVNAWLDLRGVETGPLFNPIQKNGKIVNRQLTYEATRKILHKRFLQSALAKSITWHDFRHTLAGNLFESGYDTSLIQDQFGHASIETTKKYDRRPLERRRDMISSIQVPYHPTPKESE